MQNPAKPPGMKLFPRNLTARADYLVRGNPVVSRPESGADNSHPGLEFDQRNLDRGFFPGLLFDFQFGVGARLVDVQSPWREKKEKDNKSSLDAKEGEFFLWYVYGIFGDQPLKPTIADVYGVDGYEVLRKVHDLEPGPLIIVIGRHPDELKLDNGTAWLPMAMSLLTEKAKLLKDGTLGQVLETFRASNGSLQFAILADHRADYLNNDGVIDLETAGSGVLTRSLCSPWQWDFADCGCYYWAASRPDIITVSSADGKSTQELNFLRQRGEGATPTDKLLTWSKWMDGIMSQAQMLQGWETLPVVIGDQEATSYEGKAQPKDPSKMDLWDRRKVIEQLQHLAAVEHTLCVKFLYAHYSVKSPYGVDHSTLSGKELALAKAAHEVFKVAIDEMRHFRWVNEALVMLKAQPVFSRANRLSNLPPNSAIKQHQIALRLEGLTPESLKRFIEIEKPSRDDDPDEIAGLYVHILLSLEHHPARYEDYDEETRERLKEICKLIVDEGHGHWSTALQVQECLRHYHRTEYLRFEGAPSRQPPQSVQGKLQRLGDHYYRSVLEILRQAFLPDEERGGISRGHLIRQARRVMHNLHEVGHALGDSGQGLLFTLPRLPKPGALPQDGVIQTLGTTVPRLLASLKASGSAPMADLASRHAQAASETLKDLQDGAEGNDL
jgi:hypothetical protein